MEGMCEMTCRTGPAPHPLGVVGIRQKCSFPRYRWGTLEGPLGASAPHCRHLVRGSVGNGGLRIRTVGVGVCVFGEGSYKGSLGWLCPGGDKRFCSLRGLLWKPAKITGTHGGCCVVCGVWSWPQRCSPDTRQPAVGQSRPARPAPPRDCRGLSGVGRGPSEQSRTQIWGLCMEAWAEERQVGWHRAAVA